MTNPADITGYDTGKAIGYDRSYSYDTAGRLTRVVDHTAAEHGADPAASPCQVRTYGFDNNGRRTSLNNSHFVMRKARPGFHAFGHRFRAEWDPDNGWHMNFGRGKNSKHVRPRDVRRWARKATGYLGRFAGRAWGSFLPPVVVPSWIYQKRRVNAMSRRMHW